MTIDMDLGKTSAKAVPSTFFEMYFAQQAGMPPLPTQDRIAFALAVSNVEAWRTGRVLR